MKMALSYCRRDRYCWTKDVYVDSMYDPMSISLLMLVDAVCCVAGDCGDEGEIEELRAAHKATGAMNQLDGFGAGCDPNARSVKKAGKHSASPRNMANTWKNG